MLIHNGHGRGSQNTLYKRIQTGAGNSGCPHIPNTAYVNSSGYGPGRNASASAGTPCRIESMISKGLENSAEWEK